MPRKSRSSDGPSVSSGSRRRKGTSSSSSDNSADETTTNKKGFSADLSSTEMNILSNNMVKYLLNYSATKIPVKRADIGKHLGIVQKHFPEVFKNCVNKLKKVYGLEVSEIHDEKSPKVYIVHSEFNSAITSLQFPRDQRNEISLLFIILSYIFMKGGEVQEAHIFQFLEKINISENDTDKVFGDVGKLIRETFTRQLYLKRSKVEIEGVNEIQINVTWGARAVREFDKKEVLKAVAEIMNKSPANFINQYHEAHGKEPESDSITIE